MVTRKAVRRLSPQLGGVLTFVLAMGCGSSSGNGPTVSGAGGAGGQAMPGSGGATDGPGIGGATNPSEAGTREAGVVGSPGMADAGKLDVGAGGRANMPDAGGDAGTTPLAFVHPGLLHTQPDFDRMSQKVAASVSPWIDGWRVLIANSHASLSYRPNPQALLSRGNDGVHPDNSGALFNDVAAAYASALRWKVSGDTAYADKAVEIMNAWSSTLTAIFGTSGTNSDFDGILMAAFQGYQFANVGEIMRTYPGWAAADMARFKAMMANLFYPVSVGSLHIPTGSSLLVFSSWDLGCVAAMMAIGVLTDDRAKFDQAIDYFKSGLGNGGIGQAIYYLHPGYLGQTQESGRDQGHNTLSLSLLGNICEMAWNQGVDLYGYDNNRVLAGAEYVAKGNLIQSGTTYYSLPFARYTNGSATDTAFSAASQGTVRPEWALIYNHYVNRKGLAAPYSQKFATLIQPEGGGGNYGPNSGGYDQLGYGTLTTARDPIASGAAPSGLTANVSAGQIILSWWGTAYATSYNVKRSTTAGGPYTTVAAGITDLLSITDRGLAAGSYYYVVTAMTPSGETAVSNEAIALTANQLHTSLTFDEGAGTTAADSSGHAHVGTLVNGATFAPGQKATAVSLNGRDGYVSLPTHVVVDVSDFTISAWVYWNAARSSERVFALSSNVDHYMTLTPRSTAGFARFAVSVNGVAGELGVSSTAALPTRQWVHVAVTLSGTVATLYVNGAPVGTNNAILFAPFRLSSTGQNWIGRSPFAADPYFNGMIDDFRIYRGALAAADIAALMTAP